ncbi:AAA family ATPase, putative [Penicillium digitatum PHI26]|uniref:AAA family ATPase, putative n=2 Tax=Penicillium digitatum TaxID=36651 RepID=K9F9D0_PEND2|nr:AAA family ATPase, putative [Penicillium digitatum Pd1]EKV04687.1 AAA family ATPase, putative [Penicillium digitatum PHI26]EKV16855.1 AAA family ATPase, putative [Penicillium digitatum Pd1]
MAIEISDGVAIGDSTTEPETKDIQYEPVGTICDFRTLYQTNPDSFDERAWSKEVPIDLPDPVEDAESAQYALLVRIQLRRVHHTSFPGTIPIPSLPIFPLGYHPEKDTIQKVSTERGKKWEAYKEYHFRSYERVSNSKNSKSRDTNFKDTKYRVKSRVIIDTEVYNLSESTRSVQICREIDGELDDLQRLVATPILYGYSLNDKGWCSFHVNHLKDIEWNEQAVGSLVLLREQQGLKEVILAVAKAQSRKVDEFDDIVRGKGKGFIMQLSGPLGPKLPKWGAVLLLDEADVFMKARDSNNLARNELVSIFLSMLEYYEVSSNRKIIEARRDGNNHAKNDMLLIFYLSLQGILFLTTNRTQNIDPAFESRIHLSLTYKDFDAESRRQSWAQFLSHSMNNEAFTDE